MVGHGSLNWYNAKLRPVEKVITHEKFDSETMRNDIALLKLKQPFAFRKGSTDHPSIVPVCLNDQPANKKLSAEVAGWGKVLQDASKPSDKLMYIKIDQLDDKSCSKYKTYNPALMMCAGTIEGTKDSCQVRFNRHF